MPTSLRHAWRSLWRTPVFTLTAAFTLVIGIGAAVAMFAIVDGVLLKPLPYGNSDRLVGVWNDLPPVNLHKATQTAGTYLTFKRFARSIEDMGVYQDGSVNLTDRAGGSDPQRVEATWITASIMSTLQVPTLLGRTFTADEDLPKGPNVVVISEGLWRTRLGGSRDAIGKMLDINGLSRQVIGVMPERFRFPSAKTQIWLPLQLDPNANFSGGFNYPGVARLRPGVSVEAADRDLANVLPRVVEVAPNLAPGIPTSMLLEQAKPRPFTIPLRDDVTGGIARTLWIVAAAAGLVLLVACANVANLILVRADGRQRELAVREALGAGRLRVMAHFLGESAILAAIAGVGGLVVAWVAVRTLVAAGPTEIPRLAELHIDAPTVAFTILISIVVAALCSLIPALRIGRTRLSLALREGGRSGTAGKAQHRLRGTMVALQIALALVVLAGSGLLLRTFRHLNAVRPGFDGTNATTFWMSLPRARYADDSSQVRFYAQLLQRVAALPGVRAVGLASKIPLVENGMNQNPFYVEGDASAATKIPPLQIYTTADSGYFSVMKIPLIAGRNFDRPGVQREFEAIVSQATAQQFWKDSTGRAAVGKRFRSLPTGPWYTVVGVVGSVRDTALAAAPGQAVYFPLTYESDTVYSQGKRTMALIVKAPGASTSLVSAVQSVVREIDPTLPIYDVRTMDGVVRAHMARLSFTIILLGGAAVITLLLGAIGLYGVMAYLVTLRTRELGVRIALGADPRTVAMMMTNQGLVLTAFGIGGGLLMFALVARFLRTFLFGVAASDPLTLAGASLTLVVIATLASWIPARRAAAVDPADALRAE
jgi:predicted permease